jgi:enoyl-CoA hydratase
MEKFKSLEVTREDHVAEVTLIGPGKGNAMGPDLWRELPLAFDEIDGDDAVHAVLLSGQGDHFSYGLDLPAMQAELGPYLLRPQMAAGRRELLDIITKLQRATTAVEACRKPVIAALQGWCIGAGLDIAACCDVRLCSAEARFSLREVRLAIVADLGSLQRLPSIIGQGATRELAFTGADINAERALALGLVSQVLPDPATLKDRARAVAQAIAENPPLVVQGIKNVMNFTSTPATQRGLDYVAVWNAAFMQSMDLNEAFAAFAEKRPPKFRGK